MLGLAFVLWLALAVFALAFFYGAGGGDWDE